MDEATLLASCRTGRARLDRANLFPVIENRADETAAQSHQRADRINPYVGDKLLHQLAVQISIAPFKKLF